MTAPTSSSIWKAIAEEQDAFSVDPGIAAQLAAHVESLAVEAQANAPTGPRAQQQATVLDPHPAPIPDGRDTAGLLAALGAYLHSLRFNAESGSVSLDRAPVTRAAVQGDTAGTWARPRVRHPALAVLSQTGITAAGNRFLARLGLTRTRAQNLDELLLMLALTEVNAVVAGHADRAEQAKSQRDEATGRAATAENALQAATAAADAAESQLPGLQATIDRSKAEISDLKKKLRWAETLTGGTIELPAPEPKPEPVAPTKRRRLEA